MDAMSPSLPLIAQTVNFIALIALITWMAKKPLKAHLEKRRALVKEDMEAAEKLEQQARETLNTLEARLAGLDNEIAGLRAQLIKEGESERDRIISEGTERAKRIRRDAEFQITQRFKQLRKDLLQEASDTAVELAAKLIERQLDEAGHKRLADDYLGSLRELQRGEKRRESGPSPSDPAGLHSNGQEDGGQGGFVRRAGGMRP